MFPYVGYGRDATPRRRERWRRLFGPGGDYGYGVQRFETGHERGTGEFRGNQRDGGSYRLSPEPIESVEDDDGRAYSQGGFISGAEAAILPNERQAAIGGAAFLEFVRLAFPEEMEGIGRDLRQHVEQAAQRVRAGIQNYLPGAGGEDDEDHVPQNVPVSVVPRYSRRVSTVYVATRWGNTLLSGGTQNQLNYDFYTAAQPVLALGYRWHVNCMSRTKEAALQTWTWLPVYYQLSVIKEGEPIPYLQFLPNNSHDVANYNGYVFAQDDRAILRDRFIVLPRKHDEDFQSDPGSWYSSSGSSRVKRKLKVGDKITLTVCQDAQTINTWQANQPTCYTDFSFFLEFFVYTR